MSLLAYPALEPGAYFDPQVLELERSTLFRSSWQWAGLIDDLENKGQLLTEIAGTPIVVCGDADALVVNLSLGARRVPLKDAVADLCGRFVFVRLSKSGLSLEDYLGENADLLRHCTDSFQEVYHVRCEDWDCNWKASVEIALEGYHVPLVHAAVNEYKQKGSNFTKAVPSGRPPHYFGPHSYQCGVMGPETRLEMDNIARRLKIAQSRLYVNYDHFTLFPNMMIGVSGGCLCFMQIYTPIAPGKTRLRYAYIMAKYADPQKPAVPLIKETLLQKWRDYTLTVLSEDQRACERFQLGAPHAPKAGVVGKIAEQRVAHFHDAWREAVYGANIKKIAC